MDKIKLVVVDEHTLAFIEPQTPGIAHVIRASVLRGSPHAEFGSFHHDGKVVRLATQYDFDQYRVDFTGYKNCPDEYEFAECIPLEQFQRNFDHHGGVDCCLICGKRMHKPFTHWVHLLTTGDLVASDSDFGEIDQGFFPVGSQCAKNANEFAFTTESLGFDIEPDQRAIDAHNERHGAASDDAPGFVVITTGDDVDRIDELFDPSESNATDVTPDDVLAAIRGGGKIELLPLYPMPERMPAVRQTIEYPNDVTFDVVYSQFPGGQILRVTEVLTPAGEWHSVTMYFTENEIEFWTVAEAIQRLVDQIDARAFTLEIEDEHGRVKNPDFPATDLVTNRFN